MPTSLPRFSNTIIATTNDEDDHDLLDLLSLHHILMHASIEKNGLECFHLIVPLTAQKIEKQMLELGRFQVVIDRATQVMEESCNITSPRPSTNSKVIIID